MYLFYALIVILMVFLVFAILSFLVYGVWLLIVGVFRAVFGISAPSSTKNGDSEPTWEQITARLHGLVRAGYLDQNTHRRVDQAIRMFQLSRKPLPAPTSATPDLAKTRENAEVAAGPELTPTNPAPVQDPTAGVAPPTKPAVEPPLVKPPLVKPPLVKPPAVRLEELLRAFSQVPQQPAAIRSSIMSLFQECDEPSLNQLGTTAHLHLARFLQSENHPLEALRFFRLVISSFQKLRNPQADTFFAFTIRQTAELAAHHENPERALPILQELLAMPLPAPLRAHVQNLLEGMAKPADTPTVASTEAADSERAGQQVSGLEIGAGLESALERALDLTKAPIAKNPGDSRDPAKGQPVIPNVQPQKAVPREPRRSFADMVATLMDRANIRWIEILAGLLIVGCTMALAFSLRETLRAAIPHPQVAAMGLVTALFFSLGLAMRFRWKLEEVSYGTLMIALLLVPLNFLTLAGIAPGDRYHASIVAEILVLMALTWRATPVLAPHGGFLLALALLGASWSMPLMSRVLTANSGLAWFTALGALPVLAQLLAVGTSWGRAARGDLREKDVHSLLATLGLTTFSTVVALWLLVFQGENVATVRQALASLLPGAALPILGVGLLLHHRLRAASSMVAFRAAGTGLTLLGTAALLAALALAWPRPDLLLALALLNSTLFVSLAFAFGLPVLHALALPTGAGAYLLGVYLWRGEITFTANADTLLNVLIRPHTGLFLFPVVFLWIVISEWLAQRRQKEHALYYAVGAGVLATLSGLLGFDELAWQPGPWSLVYGVYALGTLVCNLRWQQRIVTSAALLLWLWAVTWATFSFTLNYPLAAQFLGPALWGLVFASQSLLFVVLAFMLSRFAEPHSIHRDSPPLAGSRRAYMGPLQEVGTLSLIVSLLMATLAPDFPGGMGHSVTGLLGTVILALLARMNNHVLFAWGSLFLAWGTLLHLLGYSLPGLGPDHGCMVGSLIYATLALLIAWIMTGRSRDNAWSQLFHEPLQFSVALASLVVPLLANGILGGRYPLAGYFAWIAALWLGLNFLRDSSGYLVGFQVFAHLGVLEWAAAWMAAHEGGFPHPRQAVFGSALASLGILMTLLRLGLNRHPTLKMVMRPSWPRLDQGVRHLLVFYLFVWVGLALVPQVFAEWVGEPRGEIPISPVFDHYTQVFWLTLVLLQVTLLWQRWRWLELLETLLLLVTAALLFAGTWGNELASASALRWGLALGYLAIIGWFWTAPWLTRWGQRLGWQCDPDLGRLALPLSLSLTLIPVVAVTFLSAWSLFGNATSGPVADSWFGRLGAVTSLVIPLVILAMALLAHPQRDQRVEHTWGAGLLITLGAVTAHFLHVATGAGVLNDRQIVELLQTGVLVLATHLAVILAARPWINLWHDTMPQGKFLLQWSAGIMSLVHGLLYIISLRVMAFDGPTTHPWVLAVGSVMGWQTLLLTLVFILLARGSIKIHPRAILVGMLGVLVLLSCSFTQVEARWGNYTLLYGLGGYTLACAAGSWWLNTRRLGAMTPEAERRWIVAGIGWVAALGTATTGLAVNWALTQHEPAQAGIALILAGLGFAVVAAWRRDQEWAFLAGVSVHLTTSLAIWHAYQGAGDSWLIPLLQANAITSGSVALLWLIIRRWLYEGREHLTAGPLLFTQVMGGVLANLFLLLGAALLLVDHPTNSRLYLLQTGTLIGGLGLMLPLTALVVFVLRVARRGGVGVTFVSGLLLAILAACGTARIDPGTWSAFRVLTLAWLGMGALHLCAEWWIRQKTSVGQTLFSSSGAWVATRMFLGLAVLLAQRGAQVDNTEPWWVVGVILVSSLVWGALSLRSRQRDDTAVAILMVNLASDWAWWSWSEPTLATFLAVQAITFATLSCCTTLARWVRREPPMTWETPLLGGSWPAAAALMLLFAIGIGAVVADVSGVDSGTWVDPLTWSALAVTLAALLLNLMSVKMDSRPVWGAWLGLHLVMLLAIAAGLHEAGFQTWHMPRAWGLALSVFLLTTGVLFTFVVAAPQRKSLDQLHNQSAWLGFVQCQILLTIVATLCAMATSMNDVAAIDRALGVFSLLLLLPALGVHSRLPLNNYPRKFRHATFAMGILFGSSVGWALLGPHAPSLELHRCVVSMMAAAILPLLYGPGLRRLLPISHSWRETGSVAAWQSNLVALMLLLFTLIFEFELANRGANISMELFAVMGVALGIVLLMNACIRCAISTAGDPLGLSANQKQAYVYTAEILLLLLVAHLRVTRPELFALGLLERYWAFVVLGIAFVGASLSEFFQRRGLPILARPLEQTALFLPLASVLGFPIRGQGSYPLLWLLTAGFYAVNARARRSTTLGMIALCCLMFSTWTLLVERQLHFVDHLQLWLIPVGLIGLVVERLHRDQLHPTQRSTLQYLSLALIYFSSTTDMYMAGLGQSPMLPLALGGLSVLGIFVGMLLRLRSFVILGTSFLVVVIATMIRYAAVDLRQTWVWYASGIALGTTIILVFAYLEKHRDQVLRRLEAFKEWN